MCGDTDGKELKLKDTISDKLDIVEEYEKKETYQIIREIVKELPNRDRKIIMLYFGFYDDKIYTQKYDIYDSIACFNINNTDCQKDRRTIKTKGYYRIKNNATIKINKKRRKSKNNFTKE